MSEGSHLRLDSQNLRTGMLKDMLASSLHFLFSPIAGSGLSPFPCVSGKHRQTSSAAY